MSFGFSVGDFLAAITLINDIVICLKASGGSASEYQELMLELDGLRLALTGIEHLKGSPKQTPAINSIKVAALNCKFVLDSFLTKLKTYGKSLEYGKTRGWAIDSAKKVKWELAMKTDVQELRTYLMMHTSSLNMRLLTEGLAIVLMTAEHNQDVQSTLEQERKDEKRQKILEWLSLSNMYDKQHDIYSRCLENTGEWLLEEKAFVDWLEKDDSHPTLWCPGNPGTGKTVMTSIVIDYIQNRYPSKDVGIAFVYCDYKDQERQTASELIATLVKQLAARKTELPQQLVDIYEQLNMQNKRLDLRQLESLLLSLCSNFIQTFILVDALDECDALGARGLFISALQALRKASVKTFITSRPNPEDIKIQLYQVPQVEIVATESDIKRYIKEKTESNHVFMKRITPVLEEQIINTIAGRASGMFLMAVLQLERIWAERTKKKILKALESLPLGLEETYRDTLTRIKKQPEGDGTLAMSILRWISHSKRPLLIDELCHALAMEWDDDEEPQRDLDHDNILDPESLVDVCAGLVIIEDESKVIRLVHFTTEEFFNTSRGSLFPDAETQISKTCLAYLSLDIFSKGDCTSDQELETRLQLLPFLNYAARHWGHHLRGKPEQDLEEMALNLLNNHSSLLTSIQVMYISDYQYAGYSQRFPKNMTGLHVAAIFSLHVLVSLLLEKGAELETKSNYGQTPLSYAAENGHEAVVSLLLDKGAELETKSNYGQTPLSYAAENGHEAVVSLLLDKGAELETKSNYGQTPLSYAAENGHEAVVSLLLEKGAELETKSNYGWTPLSYAARNGYEAVVMLLLEKGAELETKDKDYDRTPLSWAAGNGYEAVVILLLEKGAELETKSNYGRTPLSYAAENGHEAVVSLLLEKGAELETKDKGYGRTPLSYAAEKGHEAVVSLLLEKGAELETKDKGYGRTPLSYAAEKGHEAVVSLLLEKGAELETKSNYGWTPLSYAAENGHEAVVSLLQEKSAKKLQQL